MNAQGNALNGKQSERDELNVVVKNKKRLRMKFLLSHLEKSNNQPNRYIRYLYGLY